MKQIIDGGFIAMLEARDLRMQNPMNGMFGGNRRSRAYGSSAEFADFREYAPGDDLRRIDWNLYARFEKLYLKLFVDERQLHHKIYIDASASMDWGEPNKAHIALKIAAAVGFLSVQSMDRVSFYAIHEDTCEDLCQTVVGREAFYNAVNMLNEVDFYGDGDMGAAFWYYGDTELDIADVQAALEALSADSFTDELPSKDEEIGITLHLDNENFSTVEIRLYRYDGSACLAVVDGDPVSLVSRSSVMDLVEAVQAIVLN